MAVAIALLVAIVVAIIGMRASSANGGVGVILKVVACINKRLFRYLGVVACNKLVKDSPVLTKDVVDIAHVICTIAVLPVVIRIAAVIATKLFIAAAINRLAAFGAYSHHGGGYLNR